MDEGDKKIMKILGLIILIVGTFLGSIIGTLTAITAHYQSQITGYTFWQCFWAGETIKNIQLEEKNGHR